MVASCKRVLGLKIAAFLASSDALGAGFCHIGLEDFFESVLLEFVILGVFYHFVREGLHFRVDSLCFLPWFTLMFFLYQELCKVLPSLKVLCEAVGKFGEPVQDVLGRVGVVHLSVITVDLTLPYSMVKVASAVLHLSAVLAGVVPRCAIFYLLVLPLFLVFFLDCCPQGGSNLSS